MSERLEEAAERTRLERRRTLMREVSPFLEPGEDVLEVTGGRVAAEGGVEHGVAVRVAATDRRLMVLRKRAFRQFAVDEFGYEVASVWLGYTVETGGLLELEDPTKRLRIGSVPELDLEPLFLVCAASMPPDRVHISLEVEGDGSGEREAAPVSRGEPTLATRTGESLTVLGNASPGPGPPVGAGDTMAAVHAPFEISGLPPNPPPAPAPVVVHAQSAILRWLVAQTGSRAGVFLGRSPLGEERLLVEPRKLDSETVLELVRRARAEAPGDRAAGAVSSRPEQSAASSPSLSVQSMRWESPSGSKALVVSGPTDAFGLERLRFSQFVIEWLDAPGRAAASSAGPPPTLEEFVGEEPLIVDIGEAAPAPEERTPGPSPGPMPAERSAAPPAAPPPVAEEPSPAESAFESDIGLVATTPEERPASIEAIRSEPRADRLHLVDVTVHQDSRGRPSAEVQVAWRGRTLAGNGFARTSTVGRHLAIARAAVDAVQPLIRSDVVIEHLFLSYPPLDAELVVLVVLVGEERHIGATVAGAGREDWGAARAVLDALNRRFPRLIDSPGPES